MGLSDTVLANLTSFYLAVIAAIKAFGLISGRSFSGGFVVVLSSIVVGAVLVATLTWDLSRKASHGSSLDPTDDKCSGGICWHGVAVRSPMTQVRFRLPQQRLSGLL